MDFRLGEFFCPKCGHAEPDSPPDEEPKPTGPGFRDEKTYKGSLGKSNNPAAIPLRPTEGAIYALGADAQTGKEEPVWRKQAGNLQVEKHMFFGLTVLGSVVKILSAGLLHNQADLALSPAWNAICMAAWLFALAFALFGSDLYFKYGFIGWSGLVLIGIISSLFYTSSWFSQFTAPGLYGFRSWTGSWVVILAVFGASWQAWLIWILFRDSQRLE